MKFSVTFEGIVSDGPAMLAADVFEAWLDRVMDQLHDGHVLDPAIGGKGREGVIEISATVEADSFDQALRSGIELIDKAIDTANAIAVSYSVEWRAAGAKRTALIGA